MAFLTDMNTFFNHAYDDTYEFFGGHHRFTNKQIFNVALCGLVSAYLLIHAPMTLFISLVVTAAVLAISNPQKAANLMEDLAGKFDNFINYLKS